MITKKMLDVVNLEKKASAVILWLTVVAVIVFVLVTFLSFWALRPIKKLVEGVRSVSNGKLNHTVDINSQDEIGSLAQEFNSMARSLALRHEERIRHQEKLEQVNLKLRQSTIDLELLKLHNENIIRSIPNGILVADSLGIITTINLAAEEMWGLDPVQAVGQVLSQSLVSDSFSSLGINWESVLRDKQRLSFESVEFFSEKLGVILVDLFVSPLIGHDGNVQGVIIVGEDVSDKVRTKQALIQSERLATIGRMSALVAHEIRNPLSSIGLNTELLEDELENNLGQTNQEAKELLRSIGREVERLAEVTEEYLKFARLPKPNLATDKLNELLTSLLHFVAIEFESSNIKIDSELDSGLKPVRIDENQLRQALLNLIRNSADSMPQGGTITVRTRQKKASVEISIHDTGTGIALACIEKIFDPFFSTREGGTGLGLSLTQQIVSEHGGRIRCESTPGQGTSFFIELPNIASNL